MAIDYDQIRQGFIDQKSELEQKFGQITNTIAGLTDELARTRREIIMIDAVLENLDSGKDGPQEDLEEVGLTEKVRRIIQDSTIPLAPTQIRDLLLMGGYKASSLKAALISVHTILDRLTPFLEQVEVDKRKAYKWKAVPKIDIAGPNDTLAGLTRAAGVTTPRRRIGAPFARRASLTPLTEEETKKVDEETQERFRRMWGTPEKK